MAQHINGVMVLGFMTLIFSSLSPATGTSFVDVGAMAQHNNGVVALPTNPERGQRISIMSAQVQPGTCKPKVDGVTACDDLSPQLRCAGEAHSRFAGLLLGGCPVAWVDHLPHCIPARESARHHCCQRSPLPPRAMARGDQGLHMCMQPLSPQYQLYHD